MAEGRSGEHQPREVVNWAVRAASDNISEAEEAMAMTNATSFGLVAAVWTRDISKAHWLASRIRAGQVFINTYGAGGGVELPFGGYRRSGFVREKGIEAINSCTQVKNICIKYS